MKSFFKPFNDSKELVSKKYQLSIIAGAILLGLSQYPSAATLSIGDTAPNFQAELSSSGDGERVDFYQWVENEGGKFTVLFSPPQDFTPVCATELAEVQKLVSGFKKKGVNVIGLSPNSVEQHRLWMEDVALLAGTKQVDFPVIADTELEVAKKYGMLPEDAEGGIERSAKDNFTVRTVFVLDNSSKKIMASYSYPMFIGRNFDELNRLLDGLLTVSAHNNQVAIPANGKLGDDLVLDPKVKTEQGEQNFGPVKTVELPSRNSGYPDYLRFVAFPQEGAEAE